jgi:hypothetical protein
MPAQHASGKSGWFASLLADKRSRIAHLFGEIAGLGAPADMKPSVFKRFLELLAQIAHEEERETDVLLEIEAVELKHRFRREHHQLERANPDFEPGPEGERDAAGETGENKKQRKGLFRFFNFGPKPESNDNPVQ